MSIYRSFLSYGFQAPLAPLASFTLEHSASRTALYRQLKPAALNLQRDPENKKPASGGRVGGAISTIPKLVA
ncbi:hypothetical protein NKJ09_19220 [Mesorhizobium sp. M0189]|uniref:hypothetical protein n=1 Tax=unclassified Mesorhizobium TaxID=325217 RepID=UPI0033399977